MAVELFANAIHNHTDHVDTLLASTPSQRFYPQALVPDKHPPPLESVYGSKLLINTTSAEKKSLRPAATMCGRDDDCYLTRDEVKYLFICFGVVAVVVLLAVLLAAFVYLRHVTITVEDASLTRFDLLTSPVTGIAYNLSLTLKVRNPNWAMSMKNVEPFVAAYRFDGQQFDRVQIAATGDKHPAGATRVYHLTSSSQGAFVSLGSAGEQEYKKESKTGTFDVEVALTRKVSYTARYTKCKIEAVCPLKLQLVKPDSTTVVFQKVKCKLQKAEKNC
ncbi:NDR1/HIN1-like protein 10 [Aegilops tauschii subsp. strangulata]|nr:NDR1/HIN1-like protein 10 [Aegilops tauschii subsp. strangulata]